MRNSLRQTPRTVSHAIALEIQRRGARTYGVVGNGNIYLASELQRLESPYSGMRHEAGAIAAADAHYRATGDVAVATTTYGPGFTNALTPLSEALAARIPLVYVAGVEPFVDDTLRPRAMDVDSLGILNALKVRTIIASPTSAEAAIYTAFEFARDARQPVVVAVPYNLVDAQLEREAIEDGVAHELPVTTSLTDTAGADDARRAAESIIEQLQNAERPLLLVGRGVVESATAVETQLLGDRLGALFATTAMARGAVDSEWSLGICGGFAQRGRLETFRAADVVLVLGASMNLLQMRKGTIFSPEAKILRVDWDPTPNASALRAPFIKVDELHRVPLEQLLPAMLQELGDAESAEVTRDNKTWRETIGQIPNAEDESLDSGCFAERGEDGKLDPRHVLRRLDTLLPQERSVVTDGGHFLGWVGKYLSCPDPQATVLVGGAIMTIGLGLSSATGVATARPDRFTALISGDGGTQMAMADLGPFLNAASQGAGGALFVMNDAAYGAEVHQYVPKGLEEQPMLLDEVNFAEIGRAFGVPGLRVSEPEQLADGGELAQFLADHRGSACIVDLVISRVPVADFLKE